jgi:hypothetical protein
MIIVKELSDAFFLLVEGEMINCGTKTKYCFPVSTEIKLSSQRRTFTEQTEKDNIFLV